ncbi:MAG: hypothetical protein QMC80_09010 [Thermoplasmatales archaeon]|nr:hypothetical protein [Thermoplasmatales archaeon]
MKKPNRYWNNPKNRIKAVREVVSKSGKPVTHITRKDFIEQGYITVLSKYKSLFQMLKEVGYNVNPWEMKTIPSHFWDDKGNRINTVLWLVRKLRKPAHEITLNDFVNNGLSNLARKVGSHRKALREAGYNIEYHKKKTKPSGYWNKKENRIKAVKEMVEKIGKPPSDITWNDFIRNGLSGLLAKYNQSPSAALEDTGYGVHPLKRKYLPTGYWNKKENRVKPVRDMVEKLNKPMRNITYKDFKDFGLFGLLTSRYGSSPWRALKDAGYTIGRTQLHTKPHHYWDKKERRIKAVRKMVEKTGKDPMGITTKDFMRHNLGGMLFSKYNGSPFSALKEAGFVNNEWEMKKSPRCWDKKGNRIKAVKWVVEKTGKKPLEVTSTDFVKYGMHGLLKKFKSYKEVLKEAGYNVENMPEKQPHYPRGYWNKKENRVNAVKELVKKLGKKPEKITKQDFLNNALGGLLEKYADEKCKSFSKGEIFTFDEGYLLKYKGKVTRALKEVEIV